MKVIFVDIDGTICNGSVDYTDAVPDYGHIDKINRMYDAGHEIIYWTARGTKSGVDWYDLTEQQLQEWGCRYHQLQIGKPFYDLMICDKTIRIEELY
ncbi:MAG: hypothetical protein WC132_04535 [Methanomethylophilus sp.]|jgi:histidinol phosphatase-like enzyme